MNLKLCISNELCFFLSLTAHTPDNSFMGFVAEELNETERLYIQKNKVNNMAVVYGKDASMWKASMKHDETCKTTNECILFLCHVSTLCEPNCSY